MIRHYLFFVHTMPCFSYNQLINLAFPDKNHTIIHKIRKSIRKKHAFMPKKVRKATLFFKEKGITCIKSLPL